MKMLKQTQPRNRRFIRTLLVIALLASVLLVIGLILTPQLLTLTGTPAPLPGDDWPMYLHDVQRTATDGEVILSPSNASQLTRLWTFKTGGGIAASPIIAKGTVYIGSWDGYEYALDAVTGFMKWRTYLGQTTAPCDPPIIGVTSSAEVIDNVVYVGGGDSYWYALDAYTGAVLWKVYTGDTGTDKGYYNWASPLIYKGYAYIGISSNCDNPLVRGDLLKVNLATHQIAGSATMVGPGEVGGGIWTSPTLDPATGTIYVTTGTQNQIWQYLSQAMVSIDSNTMKITGSWQIPLQQSGGDYDWGTSAVLMTDANGHKLVAGTNKNGFTYVFKRDNISAGPIWEDQSGLGGQCPICGQGTVSSGAYANGTLYIAGGNAIINGIGYPGEVRAVDPGTGKYKWEHGTPGPIIPALASANGLIIDGEGQTMEVLDARTGTRLYSYQTGQNIYAPAGVSHGQIFIGSLDGNVYSFGLGHAAAPVAASQCPHSWSCQDIGLPKVDGRESFANGAWSISGNGTGFADVTDQFRFVSQDVSGDTQIASSIGLQGLPNMQSEAGVMLRQNNAQGSPFYAAFFSASKGVVVRYRTAFNGAISTFTASDITRQLSQRYVAIQRINDVFRAAASSDGKHYLLLPGSTATIVMPTKLMGGLAVSSGINGSLASEKFTDVSIGTPTFTPVVPASVNACPRGWLCSDVGNPQLLGDQIVGNNTWTVKGEGKDIWLANDQFHFIWQPLASKNSTVSAHVVFQTKLDGLAKAGVMLRQSMGSDSVYYGAFETPDHGLTVQARSIQGLDATIITANTVITPPHYLRVTRWNNIFTTYVSPDGMNWIALGGSSLPIDVQGPMLGGIVVSSHNQKAINTVNFDSVSTMQMAPQAPTACINGWHCEDIGYPAPHGTQLFNAIGSSWTLEGGGFDIFFKTDQFHFVWQPMVGDGTISAQVKFVDPPNIIGNDYSKAGVMLRATTDPGSPYYGVFLTAQHGIMVQYRTKRGENTGETLFPDPIKGTIYLKINHIGDFYTASISNDGVAWQLVDGSTINIAMGNNLMGGLAITSHDPGNLRVATFNFIDH